MPLEALILPCTDCFFFFLFCSVQFIIIQSRARTWNLPYQSGQQEQKMIKTRHSTGREKAIQCNSVEYRARWYGRRVSSGSFSLITVIAPLRKRWREFHALKKCTEMLEINRFKKSGAAWFESRDACVVSHLAEDQGGCCAHTRCSVSSRLLWWQVAACQRWSAAFTTLCRAIWSAVVRLQHYTVTQGVMMLFRSWHGAFVTGGPFSASSGRCSWTLFIRWEVFRDHFRSSWK